LRWLVGELIPLRWLGGALRWLGGALRWLGWWLWALSAGVGVRPWLVRVMRSKGNSSGGASK